MQWVLTRDVKKLSQGQVVYSAMCYDHGGMIDDGTLFRLGRDQFRWIGGRRLRWGLDQGAGGKAGPEGDGPQSRRTSYTTLPCRGRIAAKSSSG